LQPWCVGPGAKPGVGHHSLVTPKRVLSECSEDLILLVIPWLLFKIEILEPWKGVTNLLNDLRWKHVSLFFCTFD